MIFTKKVPTTPGFYAWRQDYQDTERDLCGVVFYSPDGALWTNICGRVKTIFEMGGEWCLLVPHDEVVSKEEVKKAYREGYDEGYWEDFESSWARSRAKQVMDEKKGLIKKKKDL